MLAAWSLCQSHCCYGVWWWHTIIFLCRPPYCTQSSLHLYHPNTVCFQFAHECIRSHSNSALAAAAAAARRRLCQWADLYMLSSAITPIKSEWTPVLAPSHRIVSDIRHARRPNHLARPTGGTMLENWLTGWVIAGVCCLLYHVLPVDASRLLKDLSSALALLAGDASTISLVL